LTRFGWYGRVCWTGQPGHYNEARSTYNPILNCQQSTPLAYARLLFGYRREKIAVDYSRICALAWNIVRIQAFSRHISPFWFDMSNIRYVILEVNEYGSGRLGDDHFDLNWPRRRRHPLGLLWATVMVLFSRHHLVFLRPSPEWLTLAWSVMKRTSGM
jgi:hypothetical protein